MVARHALALAVLAGAVELIEVHGVDGQLVFFNAQEISSLRAPTSADLQRFAKGAHCVIVMTNSKFLATRESCAEIKQKLVAKMS